MSESTDRARASESPETIEQIIEIRDPSIDTARVMEEIRATLERHGPLREPPKMELSPHALNDPNALAFLLQQAQFVHDRVWIEVDTIPQNGSPLRRMMSRARRAAHELAVYYVNRHAGQQVYFNATVVRALQLLAARDAELASLREEMEGLRKRIEALESDG